jgi:hypothetical protein
MHRLSGVITVVIDRFDLAKLDPAAAAIDKSFAFIIWAGCDLHSDRDRQAQRRRSAGMAGGRPRALAGSSGETPCRPPALELASGKSRR